ncbi:MAG TPA: META domain-containing protein [Anaerolineales bacterium]|nr:META domain-containing protein [Anaerolineales bacterium]
MFTKKIISFAILASTFVGLSLAACQPVATPLPATAVPPTPPPATPTDGGEIADSMPGREHPFIGKNWNLSGYVNSAGDSFAPVGNLQLLLANDNTFAITGGCNTIGGTWLLEDGQKLTMSLGASTLMACEESLMNQETAVNELLAQVNAYQFDGETLTLTTATGGSISFQEASAPVLSDEVALQALLSSNWELTTMSVGIDAIVAFENHPTILFAADGTFSGSTGCNRYTGKYTLSEGVLTLTTGAITAMACPDALTQQETELLKALAQVSRVEVGEAGLHLVMKNEDRIYLEMLAQSTPAPVAEHPFSGKNWNLSGYVNSAGDSFAPVGNLQLLFADDNAFTITGGCNTIGGTWLLEDGQKLTMNLGPSTLMACEESLMNQETAVNELLAQVNAYQLDGETLTLTTATGGSISFQEASAPALSDSQVLQALLSSNWELAAMSVGLDTIVAFETRPTILFTAEGTFSGNTGCNQFFGNYTLAEGVLTLVVGGTTRKACSDALMQQETAVLKALAQVYRVEFGEAGLHLIMNNEDRIYLEMPVQ